MKKIKRTVIEIDENLCDGCGKCVNACALGVIEIVNGKAKVVKEDLCDGFGACIGQCPQNAIKLVEKEVIIDEEKPECEKKLFEKIDELEEKGTLLKQWPIKLRLVPPTASFLKDSHLLIVADCVPVAYPDFHQTMLEGKSIVIGCPKFDNPSLYLQKLTDIFSISTPKSVTTLVMEVPCCHGFIFMVEKAIQDSKADIPHESFIVGINGKILK